MGAAWGASDRVQAAAGVPYRTAPEARFRHPGRNCVYLQLRTTGAVQIGSDVTMPKPRAVSRGRPVDFAVAPWQDKKDSSAPYNQQEVQHFGVEEVDLVTASAKPPSASGAPAGAASQLSPAAAAPLPDPVGSSGWLSRGLASPGASQRQEEGGRDDGPRDGEPGGDAANASPAASASSSDADEGDVTEEPSSETLGAEGVCQLGITPIGQGVGNLVLLCDGRHVCLGLATRRVGTPPTDPCFSDGSIYLVEARITNYASGTHLDVLSECSGGDMVRLSPPEPWLLHSCLAEPESAEVEAKCQVQLSFQAEMLLSGEAAAGKLPVALRGRQDACMCIGPCRMEGLPWDFLGPG